MAKKSRSTQQPNVTSARLQQPVSCNRTILAVLNENVRGALPGSTLGKGDGAGNGSPMFLDEGDLAIFERFRQRTVFTVGTAKTNPLFTEYVVPMAFQYPFLLHTLLTLTLLHDDHLSLPQSKQHQARTTLHHHWTLATHLFQHRLSQPVDSSSGSLRDALWATAALLGSTVIAFIEPGTRESEGIAKDNVWPLKPSEPSDLNWLALSAGKQAIWKIAQPDRKDSFWSKAVGEMKTLVHERDEPNKEGARARWESCGEGTQGFLNMESALPSGLAAIFDVDPGATLASALEMRDAALKNPDAVGTSLGSYTLPLLVLQHLRSLRGQDCTSNVATSGFPTFAFSLHDTSPTAAFQVSGHNNFRCTQKTLFHYLGFIAYLPPTFKNLLENKDARALLLLRWWYELLEDSEVWWLKEELLPYIYGENVGAMCLMHGVRPLPVMSDALEDRSDGQNDNGFFMRC